MQEPSCDDEKSGGQKMPDNGQVTLQWIKIYIHIYKNAININDNNDDDNHNLSMRIK